MWDSIIKSVEFAVDKTKPILFRIIILLVVLFLFLAVNNLFGFSFYHNAKGKVEVLKGINDLLKDDSVSEATKTELRAIEKDVLQRTTWFSAVFHKFFGNKNASNPGDEQALKNETLKKWTWFFANSWVVLLMAIVVLIFLIKSEFKKRNAWQKILLILAWLAGTASFMIVTFGIIAALPKYLTLNNLFWNGVVWQIGWFAVLVLFVWVQKAEVDAENAKQANTGS